MRLLIGLWVSAVLAFAAPSYQSNIIIQASQCGASDSTNFPVLVKLSGTIFKTVGNGGHVQNANGYDILFWQDAPRSTALTWEIDYYDGTNGVGWFWVKIPTVSHTVNTEFYVSYGDSTISTFQSIAANVWTNNFDGVWHMSADSSTVRLTDSTTNANNGTNHSSTAGAGQVAGAGAFVAASNQYAALTDAAALQPNTLTLSMWFKITNSGANKYAFRKGSSGYYQRAGTANGQQCFVFDSGGNAIGVTSAVTVSDGNWHYGVCTFDATSSTTNALNFYVDGSTVNSANAVATGAIKYGANAINIASDIGAPTTTWNGSLDEIRVATGVRSADWILTEYNNQTNPTAFAVVGQETGATVGSQRLLIGVGK